jgi:hypothetical protein
MSCTAHKFRKVLSANSTSTGFTAQTPTATEPSGEGVLNLLSSELGWGGGVHVPRHLVILPFGTNGDNDTFDLRVYGYSPTNDSTPIYVPQLLIDVSIVLGNIAATAIAADTFMADTITVNEGPAVGNFSDLISTADDTPASILIHTRGCEIMEFDFDLAGAQEGVSMNAYWRMMDSCY